MKIGSLDSTPSSAPVAADRKAGTAAATGGAADTSTQVALSSAAKLGVDSADGSFDSEKVTRIAQAIRDGKFTVNPNAIADKLISNAQELLGKSSR